eukprot:158997_1
MPFNYYFLLKLLQTLTSKMDQKSTSNDNMDRPRFNRKTHSRTVMIHTKPLHSTGYGERSLNPRDIQAQIEGIITELHNLTTEYDTTTVGDPETDPSADSYVHDEANDVRFELILDSDTDDETDTEDDEFESRRRDWVTQIEGVSDADDTQLNNTNHLRVNSSTLLGGERDTY